MSNHVYNKGTKIICKIELIMLSEQNDCLVSEGLELHSGCAAKENKMSVCLQIGA